MKSEAAESFRHGSREESGQLYFVRRHKKYRSKRHVACSDVARPNTFGDGPTGSPHSGAARLRRTSVFANGKKYPPVVSV